MKFINRPPSDHQGGLFVCTVEGSEMKFGCGPMDQKTAESVGVFTDISPRVIIRSDPRACHGTVLHSTYSHFRKGEKIRW